MIESFAVLALILVSYKALQSLANWYGDYLVKKENKECEDE